MSEINQETLKAVIEGMKNYRPNLSKEDIECHIQRWLDTDIDPWDETSQDCVTAYKSELAKLAQ